MYRVLIAEDEFLVRLGLKNSINWDKFNMMVAADVSNGLEAWEAYETMKPDVIITDIRMPIMDGLELIRKIREKDQTTRIVILSCVEEFETARRAITYGVTDYITKLSMSRQDMEAVIARVSEELMKSQEGKGYFADNDLFHSKENYIKGLLSGETHSLGIHSSNEFEGILNFKQECLCILLLEIDHYSDMQVKLKSDKIRSMVTEMIKKAVEGFTLCEVLSDSEKRYTIIINLPEQDDLYDSQIALEMIQLKVRKVIGNYLGTTVSIGISSKLNGFEKLKALYEQAVKSLQMKFCEGVNRTYLWEDNDNTIYVKKLIDKLKKKQDLFFSDSLINDANKVMLKAKLQAAFENGLHSDIDVLKLFFQFMYWNTVDLSNSGTDASDLLMQYQKKLLHAETMDELFAIYSEYLAELKDMVSKARHISRELKEAIRYMEANFDKNPSLLHVADFVGLSSNYLSSLFTKEIGRSFVEYFNSIRIQKAKCLLLETNLKLYEIAERVGFSDEAYFSRTFKKFSGKSPITFRRQYNLEAVEVSEDENC